MAAPTPPRPTTEELQQIFRATGFVTNSQAWGCASLAVALLNGGTFADVLKAAEDIRREHYRDDLPDDYEV